MHRAVRALLDTRVEYVALAGGLLAAAASGWGVTRPGKRGLAAVTALDGAILLAVAVSSRRTERLVRVLRKDLTGRINRLDTQQDAHHAAQLTQLTHQLKLLSKSLDAARASGQAVEREINALPAALARQVGRTVRDVVAKRVTDSVTEVAAVHNLHAILDVAHEMPAPNRWAATPRTLLRLVSLALALPENGLVVECGSGTSTVWLALACRQAGRGRVVALEHQEIFAEQTRAALAAGGLENYAEVRVATLEPVMLGGTEYTWYKREAWADLSGIDVLFVDGPPGAVQPLARFPAVPLLAPALKTGAVVVLDDSDRADEKLIAETWLTDPTTEVQLRDIGVIGRATAYRVDRDSTSPEHVTAGPDG